MGRPRRTNQTLPPGVRVIRGRYYWRPTSAKERKARQARGDRATIPLGADPKRMRIQWAEQFAGPERAKDGTVGALLERYEREEIPRKKSPKTRHEYARSIAVLTAAFGTLQIARNQSQASDGRGLRTLDVQLWLDRQEAHVAANRHLAVLSDAFACGRRWGETEHNPCQGVRRHSEEPRDRLVEPWERELLIANASPMLSIMIRWVGKTGWREADIRGLHESQIVPEGIRLKQSKRGKRQLWLWDDELRALVEEARNLRGVRGLYLFATRRGGPLSVSGFQSMWRRTIAKARKAAAEAGLAELPDLHFHDLRAEAISAAKRQGMDAQQFAGHSDPRLTSSTYLRDEVVLTPLTRGK